MSLTAKLATATGQAGLAAARSIVTADYRGYDLQDFLPLEQIYVPMVSLPPERHPSLLLAPDQKNLIRERVLREPYRRWWQTVLRKANASQNMNLMDSQLAESKRSSAAKSCAFAYLVTGEDLFFQQARQALIHISPPPAVTTPEGGRLGEGWGDWIRASFIMLDYCVAYDLMAEELSTQDRQLISERIAAETDQLYRNLKFAPPNNHKTIMAAAVGTAALTIPSCGGDQPQRWLDAAMLHLRSGLAQIDPDGSYREGTFYAGYISQQLFPFLFYLKKAAGVDLFSHQRLEDLVAWFLRVTMPDGTIPLFDDTWQEKHPFLPMLVGQSRLGGVARWRYENVTQPESSLLKEVEFICAFDDRVPAQPPPWERTAFFPDGGMAVFGNGWSSDGLYLLLLGEDQSSLASGHEHMDPGNFVLQAYGQDLIIDPGYGPRGRESRERSWYLSGEGHNMLLVDGKGPVNNPFSDDQLGGELMHCFSSSLLSGAAVRTQYGGSQIQRTVFFIQQRYFLIFDQLCSQEPHHYDLVLHGLGQALLEGPEHISWSAEDVRLRVQLVSTQQIPPALSLRTGQWSPLYLHPQTYTYLKASRPQQRHGYFATLLIPERTDLAGLELAESPALSGDGGRAWEIFGEDLGEARHTLMATDGQSAAGGMSTDGLVSLIGLDGNGRMQFFVTAGGTFCAHLGDTCFISDRPVTVSMMTFPDRWSGYVDAGDDTVSLTLETGFDPGRVRFGEFPHPYRYCSGRVHLSLPGSGPLELGSGPPLISTPQKTRPAYPFLEQVARQDEPMARWEELSPEQRFLAQQQALYLARQHINEPLREMSRRMGLGPDGLSRVLGVTTGLADKAYDDQDWVRLNLPQHLEGQRSLPWGQFSYRQEGHITEEGLRVERLEGRLQTDGQGTVMAGHHSPCPGVVHRTLGYEGQRITLAARREEARRRRRHQISLFHHPGPFTWGLQGQAAGDFDEYNIDLLYRGAHLRAEASRFRGPQGLLGKRFFLCRQGQRLSPQVELKDEGGADGQDLRAGWASCPATAWSWDVNAWMKGALQQLQVQELSSTVTGQGAMLSGGWNCSYRSEGGILGWTLLGAQDDDTRWTLRWRYRQRHRPFVVEERSSLSHSWDRWLSASLGLIHRPRREVQDDLLLDLTAHLLPQAPTCVHFKLETNSRQSDRMIWGLGLDHWGSISWGGEWTRRWRPDGCRGSHLSLHGSWTDAGGRGLRGRVELELYANEEVETYQIEIQQLGPTCSPGLLFSRDPLSGVRNDGFLGFRF